MPDLKNKTIAEARTLLESYGFRVHIDSSVQDTDLVTNQMPKRVRSYLKMQMYSYILKPQMLLHLL